LPNRIKKRVFTYFFPKYQKICYCEHHFPNMVWAKAKQPATIDINSGWLQKTKTQLARAGPCKADEPKRKS
jgi:hypothetical protein